MAFGRADLRAMNWDMGSVCDETTHLIKKLLESQLVRLEPGQDMRFSRRLQRCFA